MERRIFAIIGVDDETAFREIDDGPVHYLEKEFGWLEESGICLKDCFIADEDEDDKWEAYLNYLVEWAFDHQGEEFEGMTPACFDEFCENKCPVSGDAMNNCEVRLDSIDCHCANGECAERNVCPDCGTEMKETHKPPHIRFCPSCGKTEVSKKESQRVEEKLIGCPACGERLSEDV